MDLNYRAIAVIAIGLFLNAGCNDNNGPNPVMERGRILSKQYCASCHQYPEPALLNKSVWYHSVLPQMSSLLGLRYIDGASYFAFDNPPVITVRQWDTLLSYYVNAAPDTLQLSYKTAAPITGSLKQFDAAPISFGITQTATTCVQIAPGNREKILLGDGFSQELFATSLNGTPDHKDSIGTCIVNVHIEGDTQWILTAGIMRPGDSKEGRLVTKTTKNRALKVIFDSLQRPVFAEYADVNKDGLQDIVMCEYGNLEGRLSWFERKADGSYNKHILREMPGAIRTSVRDLDGDGRPDIMVLMAQADEGLFIYYQQSDGDFREKRVLKFPPVFGVNYFELADFNGDGKPDVVLTDGDNGDYSPVLKPYHGIRIFLNDGQNNFSEKLFLPVNGAGKAMARDFDGDGDLDIASIAFFADFEHRPHEGFIYWENTGNLSFKAYSGPEALDGHWLTMDVGDVNDDGAPDIVLGSANIELGRAPESLRKQWSEKKISALLLTNKLKLKS